MFLVNGPRLLIDAGRATTHLGFQRFCKKRVPFSFSYRGDNHPWLILVNRLCENAVIRQLRTEFLSDELKGHRDIILATILAGLRETRRDESRKGVEAGVVRLLRGGQDYREAL